MSVETDKSVKAEYLGLIGFDQDFADFEVQHLIIPSTGQYVVTHTGQRITHKEISITQNQSLRHLENKNVGGFKSVKSQMWTTACVWTSCL